MQIKMVLNIVVKKVAFISNITHIRILFDHCTVRCLRSCNAVAVVWQLPFVSTTFFMV